MTILADNDFDGLVKNVMIYQYNFLTKIPREKKKEEKSETVNMLERKREHLPETFRSHFESHSGSFESSLLAVAYDIFLILSNYLQKCVLQRIFARWKFALKRFRMLIRHILQDRNSQESERIQL